MRALNGLTKAETLRLVEIEGFAESGTRLDGLHVTDTWVEESIQFLVTKLRPRIEAFTAVASREEAYCLVHLEAKKAHRLWKRGADAADIAKAMNQLEQRIQIADRVSRDVA